MEQVTLSVPAVHGDAPGVLAGPRPAPRTSTSANLVIALDRGIYRIARHWLLAVNALFVTYMASLLLAPLLVAWGYAGLARPIYAFNGLFCHQRADRSFTILGEKMACCERCAAIYGSMMLAGLVFAFVRGHIRRLQLSDVLLLALPIAVDGGAQLVGLWHSTTGSRLLSGAVFGVAVCWFLLPYLESGFGRMRAARNAVRAARRRGPRPATSMNETTRVRGRESMKTRIMLVAWVALIVVIAATQGRHHSAGSTANQGSTPAALASPDASGGIVRSVLVGATPASAPDQSLQLVRYVIQPGTVLPAHIHPGTQLAWIESGELTYTVVRGQIRVERSTADGTPGPAEWMKSGETTVLRPGDAVIETEGNVHFGENRGTEPLVILAATLLEAGQPPSIVQE